ncbi:MAG TPA: hypothetical protein VEV16_07460 [Daejeonella sp.]|nr:hypothetical protein [Daejeonella sp.]
MSKFHKILLIAAGIIASADLALLIYDPNLKVEHGVILTFIAMILVMISLILNRKKKEKTS